MNLVVNGDELEVEEGCDLTSLLKQIGLPLSAILVEHNGLALRREECVSRPLAAGDRIEIVRIVAGG